MGLACSGLTHCEECGSSLGMNEFLLCSSCRAEKDAKRKELEEKCKEEQRLKIADMVELRLEIANKIKEGIMDSVNKWSTPSKLAKEISISIDKPREMSNDKWCTEIGCLILELSQRYDGVSVKFISEEE